MSTLAERCTHLCHSYTQLAERFQKLDVEHMTLKSKMIPLLKALKAYRKTVEMLTEEKAMLEEKLQEISLQYEALRPLESLLSPEIEAAFVEAEEQMSLIDLTLQEMHTDADPDLSDTDKQLLNDYRNHADWFLTTEVVAEPIYLHEAVAS